jgi:hypothetical protein
MSQVAESPSGCLIDSGRDEDRVFERLKKLGSEDGKETVARTPFGAADISEEGGGDAVASPGKETAEEEDSSEDGDDVSTLKRKLAFDEVPVALMFVFSFVRWLSCVASTLVCPICMHQTCRIT